MKCHHYCNEPLRCPECVKRFWKWLAARTNSPPRKKEKVSFYDHVVWKDTHDTRH